MSNDIILDIRSAAPKDRHPLIFGQFTWEYLEEGPEVWRVRIGRGEEG